MAVDQSLANAPDDLVGGRLYPELLTAREAAFMVRREPATIRYWAHRGWIYAASHGPRGQALYRRRDLWDLELATRQRRSPGRPRRSA